MIGRKSMEDVASGDGELFFSFDSALQHLVGRLSANVVVRRAGCDFYGWLSWLSSMWQLSFAGDEQLPNTLICSPV